MAPLSPETAAVRAGRLMLAEIDFFVRRRADFGFETTLAGRGYLKLIRNLKSQGYRTHFFFLWVPTVDVALSRVKQRVLQGGHNVPEADVRRRFERSIRNFLVHYRLVADSWILFDSSSAPPSIIAREEQKLRIMKPETYDTLISRYGRND